MKALRERHTQKKPGNVTTVQEGGVVIMKGDEKNRGHCKLGIVTNLIKGKDVVVRGVKLRAGEGTMERPIQLIYPFELRTETKRLNPKAKEFRPKNIDVKPERRAQEIVKALIQHFEEEDSDEVYL